MYDESPCKKYFISRPAKKRKKYIQCIYNIIINIVYVEREMKDSVIFRILRVL